MSDNTTIDGNAVTEIERLVRTDQPVDIVNIKAPDLAAPVPVLVKPGASGISLESVLEYVRPWRGQPMAQTGTTTLLTLDALIDYVNRYKNPSTSIYFDTDKDAPRATAILSHTGSDRDMGSEEKPGAGLEIHPEFADWRASYCFPLSEEWKTWADADGETITTAEFAEWLEDRINDIAPPPKGDAWRDYLVRLGGHAATPDQVMELSRGVSIHVASETKTKLDLASGQHRLVSSEEHRNGEGKPIDLPKCFFISIPVFEDGARYLIPVRLRYRARGGGVTWTMIMHRPDLSLKNALNEARETLATKTGCHVYTGQAPDPISR